MQETHVPNFMVMQELSLMQRNWIGERFGHDDLTVGRMIELIYLKDPKAELRIRHFPADNEYKISAMINGHPIARLGAHLHFVLFDLLKAIL